MMTRNLDKAKAAWKSRDIEASRRAHEAGGQRAASTEGEPHEHAHGQYIKSVVYGGLDGIITTFAVVAGVAGASLSTGIVLILGFANLVADGLSMAIGDYLSTKSENEYNRAERHREQWEVEHYPEGEKLEMIELYRAKGLSRQDAETIVDIISKDHKVWIDIMMVEELGIVESEESPLKNASATFVSFAGFGFVPLIAYIVVRFVPTVEQHLFPVTSVLTGATLFALGAVKVRITGQLWWRSGLETLLVGGVAAAAAYGIGRGLAGLA